MAPGPRHRAAAIALAVMSTALLLAASACTGTSKPAAIAEVENTEHVCSSCHGMDGRSTNPTFPRLAGQQEEYLAVQLKAFRDKSRADPHAHTYMWGMAARLSDQTIAGLAAFYAAQPPASGETGDAAEIAVGARLFAEGFPAKDVPACATCHGAKAEGNGQFPRLAAQHRSYIEDQLQNFASNSRANEIMHETSKNLTPEQIRQVATFLAAQ